MTHAHAAGCRRGPAADGAAARGSKGQHFDRFLWTTHGKRAWRLRRCSNGIGV